MKRPVFLILGICFALVGCAGGGHSSSQSASAQRSTANMETAATRASVADLPVYPGATKMAYLGPTSFTRCGHKISVTTYDVNADAKSVSDWYGAHIPGGIRVTKDSTVAGGTGLTMTEIFEPSGVGVAAITQIHFAATSPSAGQHRGGAGVHIGLGTYEPALSPTELQTMQAFMGSDPAAKQQAIARMKAKCGPNSAGGI